MKKTLLESLVDYDMSMLDALASTRGATLSSRQSITASKELAEQLISPASLAIVLADLSPAESRALASLQSAGGCMESPRFTRQFGDLRPMGPGRLARERPWVSPANPAEALWYRGLVFQGFRPTSDGVVEVFYIPEDLLALLPPPPATEPPPTLVPAEAPIQEQIAATALVEDVFNILVYLRRHATHLAAADALPVEELQAINALCLRPLPADQLSPMATAGNRLAFLTHVCQAAGLITPHQQRLVVSRERARAWLEAPHARQLYELYEAWRDDGDWNDLQHVPSLRPQATGWRNDPLLARQTVLRALISCPPLTWHRLDDLAAAIKKSDPDFQRPDGDYSTWYIHDLNNRPLMGFEHWDDVEGALIRHLLICPLHWLGVIDTGGESETALPTVFRVSAVGAYLLGQASLPADESRAAEALAPLASVASAANTGFTVQEDFTARVTPGASLVDRFQLARFTEFVGRDGATAVYRITPAGVNQVGRQGVNAGQISAFLLRITNRSVPQRVLDAVVRWQKVGAARLERALILYLEEPETLVRLRRDPVFGPLLGPSVGPTSVVIPPAHEQQVRRWLAEHGYL